MGKNTNQIATHYNFFKAGHTYLPKDDQCVTYGDMYYKSNLWPSYHPNWWSGSSMLNTGHAESLGDGSGQGNLVVDAYKCVKYQDYHSRPVRVPWLLKISEGVSGATRARTIEIRYYYKTTSTASETYKVIGSYTWGSNITNSAEMLMYIEANPYAVINQDLYSSNVKIWCGTTNIKQDWKWRMRTQGTTPYSGSWTAWQSGGKGTSCLAAPLYGGYVTNDALRALTEQYNGVEFYMK